MMRNLNRICFKIESKLFSYSWKIFLVSMNRSSILCNFDSYTYTGMCGPKSNILIHFQFFVYSLDLP